MTTEPTFANPLPASDDSTNRLSDFTSKVKTKAADLGHAALDKIDASRVAASGGLASAATSLHSHAEDMPGSVRIAKFAHGAADKVTATADYIRDHDVDAMVTDVKTLVKNNPVPALLGAAVVGFFLGRAFKSND